MDEFAGKNRSELLEIVQKVLDNRNSKEDFLTKINQTTVAGLQAPHTFSPDQATYKKKKKPYKRTNVLQAIGTVEK